MFLTKRSSNLTGFSVGNLALRYPYPVSASDKVLPISQAVVRDLHAGVVVKLSASPYGTPYSVPTKPVRMARLDFQWYRSVAS